MRAARESRRAAPGAYRHFVALPPDPQARLPHPHPQVRLSQKGLALPLTPLVALTALLCVPVCPDEETRPRRARVYTNDDLERVAPRRGETGVLSTAPPAPPAAEARSGREPANGQGEEYWRREAERVRDRVEALRERTRDLRLRIEERRKKPGARPYSDPQVEALQERLSALEARMREMESSLHDRARRAGALPGWLR